MKSSNSVKIQVIDTTQQVEESEEEYDTYPPPNPDFVYEDPYVTKEELAQISGASQTVTKPKKPSSAYFYFMQHNRCIYQRQHPK